MELLIVAIIGGVVLGALLGGALWFLWWTAGKAGVRDDQFMQPDDRPDEAARGDEDRETLALPPQAPAMRHRREDAVERDRQLEWGRRPR